MGLALLLVSATLLLLGAFAQNGQAAAPNPIPTPGTGTLPAPVAPTETLGEALNPSNYDCKGHLSAGTPAPGDDDTQVQYRFGCSGPITGYAIQPQIGDSSFGDSAVVFDPSGKVPITTDSFTCSGTVPGFGFNCTGTGHGGYAKVVGQFAIPVPLCAEPRVDALLTVVLAGVDSKGNATTAISGPFDLGRPHGCPRSVNDGKIRIPDSGVASWYPTGQPIVTKLSTKPVTKKKAAKKKAKAKTKAAATRA